MQSRGSVPAENHSDDAGWLGRSYSLPTRSAQRYCANGRQRNGEVGTPGFF